MKRLVIEIRDLGDWGKVGRIKEQTHREEEFGKNDNSFYATNGFELCSFNCLEGRIDKLFVQGESVETGVFSILSEEWLDKLRVAVREYNEYFADKKEEPKQVGDIEIIE